MCVYGQHQEQQSAGKVEGRSGDLLERARCSSSLLGGKGGNDFFFQEGLVVAQC